MNKPLNKYLLHITADDQPTVLERILQVTRYRGFKVSQFNVLSNAENNQLMIDLAINDPKEFDSPPNAGIQRLYHQLNKLFDIKHVNLAPIESIQNQA